MTRAANRLGLPSVARGGCSGGRRSASVPRSRRLCRSLRLFVGRVARRGVATVIPQQIIARKRDGEALPPEELGAFLEAYLEGTVGDDQMAAFLMAVYFNGLAGDELNALVEVMIHSGEVIERGEGWPGPRVDKHSTGGVGDKVSLVLAPLAAEMGMVVPMMSGRGLGHTGGTLDKLESIPGFRTRLPLDEFDRVLREVGCAMIGQTDEIAPLDRKLYALRDVTADRAVASADYRVDHVQEACRGARRSRSGREGGAGRFSVADRGRYGVGACDGRRGYGPGAGGDRGPVGDGPAPGQGRRECPGGSRGDCLPLGRWPPGFSRTVCRARRRDGPDGRDSPRCRGGTPPGRGHAWRGRPNGAVPAACRGAGGPAGFVQERLRIAGRPHARGGDRRGGGGCRRHRPTRARVRGHCAGRRQNAPGPGDRSEGWLRTRGRCRAAG